VFSPSEEDVGALVHTLVALMSARAMRGGVTLEAGGGDDASRVVFTLDRDRLKDALLNLVQNALDATPADGVVRVAYRISADHHLLLTVSDSGKGMDDATLARLGTPFFTQREGGTGLGVALARQVAHQHRGTLSFESAPGRGTRALLTLPPVRVELAEQTP
jgi:signal transduction histidine kinase